MNEEVSPVVRALYGELRGYLDTAAVSGAPQLNGSLGRNLAAIIAELREVTGRDYSRFQVEEQRSIYGDLFVDGGEYRGKISGLVSRLEQEYGLAQAMTGGSGAIEVNLNQTLSQITHVSLSVELNAVIEKRIAAYPEGSKEQTFLRRVRDSLGMAKDVGALIATVAKAAQDAGISPTDIARIFGSH